MQDKMPDIVNYSFITRIKLADEIQERAIAANHIYITFNKNKVAIKLIFGENVDMIIYVIDSTFYNKFLKSTFE